MASNFESIPEGVAVPIIAGLGIFGNITCLLVLSNKSVDLKPSFSNLLKCLAVYDILILVNTIFIQSNILLHFHQIGMLMMYSWPSISLRYKQEIRPYIIPYALPLTQVKQTKQQNFTCMNFIKINNSSTMSRN